MKTQALNEQEMKEINGGETVKQMPPEPGMQDQMSDDGTQPMRFDDGSNTADQTGDYMSFTKM